MSSNVNYINNCGGVWPNGGPEPPRVWTRSLGNECLNISNEELNMRRKSHVLLYTNNAIKQTKNQRFAYIAKRKTNSTDGMSCGVANSPAFPASASDVPGNQLLYLNPNIPLTRWVVQRQYKAGVGKWPQSTI
jgi:hypothetical protein